MLISHERLLATLDYAPDTGLFTWICRRNGVTVGQKAGNARPDGYITIIVDKHKYYAHRLAWFYVYGQWPDRVDHVNGNTSDNRLCNIRLATASQNMMNRAGMPNNKFGLKGVSRNGTGFRAVIKKDRRYIHLGTFKTPEKAHFAYQLAATELHGQFARIN